MADAIRQLAIAQDPEAYDNIGAGPLTLGYDTLTDKIKISTSVDGDDDEPFTAISVTSIADNANRDVIIEETINTVAAASIYGGTYAANGNFECAFRPLLFESSGLLESILGLQGTITGGNYRLSQTPSSIALKIVDEQATLAGVRGSTTIYRGVGITSLELNLNVKEYVRCTINWLGRNAEVYDVPYNTTGSSTEEPSIFYNAVLKFAGETLECKGVTLNMARKMDEEHFFVGSQFLQGLYYNGLTDLSGQITLGPSDWKRIRTMLAGSLTAGMLDEGATEFSGDNANAIPSGRLELNLMNPAGSAQVAKITVDECKLTEMARSVQGRNQFEKTVNWKAAINPPTKDFVFHIGA